MRPHLRARWPLWAALAIVTAWGGVAAWRRAARETMVLARTTCPFWGEPRVQVSPDVPPADTAPVRVHEEVHAAQCRALGPWRYRARNLSARGKLELEAPAYCAGAEARLAAGEDSSRVRRRLRDDITEALGDVADSAAVVAALGTACPRLLAAHSSGQRDTSAVRSRQP